jgi:peptide chain release factor 1
VTTLPLEKLKSIEARYEELEEMLCQPDVLADSKRMLQMTRERSDVSDLVAAYREYTAVTRKLAEDREALADPDLRALVEEEIPELEAKASVLEKDIELLLLPRDPNDSRNTIFEIRSGTGGEEAALFAADLFRMYSRYAEKRGWRIEIMSTSEASGGGLKEVIALVSGDKIYSQLRFEGGVHRVQRVPATETQGRIHTSTATIAVLPEADEVDVEIRDEDLEINIAASGGPGGQGVNTTNSAVQIQHKPSGLIVKCQDERSQLKNKAKAMKVLRSRLLEIAQNAAAKDVADERRGMVGSGERSEKIRTYNYPQNRVTDHRIGLTLHNLDGIMNGDLDELFIALRTNYQAALIQSQSGT